MTLRNNQCKYIKDSFPKENIVYRGAKSVVTSIMRLFDSDGFKTLMASTTIKGSSTDGNAEYVVAPFCLGNSNGSQYIQPKLYKQLFIPYFANKNNQTVNLVEIDSNNQTKIIQQTVIQNNRAIFSDVNIQPNFRYLVKFADNMGNATEKGFDDIELHPRDINEERKNGSFSIPALNYNSEVSVLENDLTYDVNILNNNTTHLFIYALNDITNQSVSLTEAEKNSALNYIDSYINHFCKMADNNSK